MKNNPEPSRTQTTPVRIALIGCGAVAELLHLPALLDRTVQLSVSIVNSSIVSMPNLLMSFSQG